MNYPVASITEYGYKERKALKVLWKIVQKLLVLITVVGLYIPIIVIAIQSLNVSTDASTFTGFTFYWYTHMFENQSLAESIKNTFIISVTATIASTILGTLIAIGINYLPAKARQKVMLINNIPLLNADIVTGVSLMLVFSLLLPIFPYIFGFPTLFIAHVFFTLPYIILSVLLPAVKSGIFSGAILAFTISFEDFVVSYFTTGNGFNTLSIWLYSSKGKNSLTPSVYAFNTILIVVSIALIVGYQLVKGKMNHAKKH